MVLVRMLTRRKWSWLPLIGLIGVAAIGVGLTLPATAPARAADRRAAPPAAFLSGSERSVPILREIAERLESGNQHSETVLREIATTLERIDTRLRRIEQAMLSEAAKQRASQPPNPNNR